MFDEHAVAVRREERVVGHLPHEFQGSSFTRGTACEIIGHRHLDISLR